MEGDATSIGPALARWIGLQMERAGLTPTPIDGSANATIAATAQQGLGAVLLSSLEVPEGVASLQLTLGAVLTASESKAPREERVSTAADGLVQVLERLGVDALRPTPAPLDELVCTGQSARTH